MKKKKKRKIKNQSLIKGIFPKSLGKAYIDFKKQQDANNLKKLNQKREKKQKDLFKKEKIYELEKKKLKKKKID